jgi:hypothetical protein
MLDVIRKKPKNETKPSVVPKESAITNGAQGEVTNQYGQTVMGMQQAPAAHQGQQYGGVGI